MLSGSLIIVASGPLGITVADYTRCKFTFPNFCVLFKFVFHNRKGLTAWTFVFKVLSLDKTFFSF